MPRAFSSTIRTPRASCRTAAKSKRPQPGLHSESFPLATRGVAARHGRGGYAASSCDICSGYPALRPHGIALQRDAMRRRPATNLKHFGNKNGRFLRKTCRFLCHCEERSDVAILKPKAWNSEAKHGSRKRQNSKISIRPAGTPPRRFPGSAISRSRKAAFHMQSIFHSAKGRISLRGLAVLRSGMPPCAVKDCRNDIKKW